MVGIGVHAAEGPTLVGRIQRWRIGLQGSAQQRIHRVGCGTHVLLPSRRTGRHKLRATGQCSSVERTRVATCAALAEWRLKIRYHTPAKSGRRRRTRATGGNRRCGGHTAWRDSLRLCTTLLIACLWRQGDDFLDANNFAQLRVGRDGLTAAGMGLFLFFAMHACGTPANCRRMWECR